LLGAQLLGADVRDAVAEDAGDILAKHLITLMQSTNIPNGISGVGYHDGDLNALAAGAFAQPRLIKNAPRAVDQADLVRLFAGALSYW
jgi:alcohol dehydrogenase class IV